MLLRASSMCYYPLLAKIARATHTHVFLILLLVLILVLLLVCSTFGYIRLR